MAQALKCTHCGAVLKPKNPIAAGKKVKCPKCEKAFVVEDEEEPEEEEAEEEAEKDEDEEESSEDEGDGDEDADGGGDDEEADEDEDEKPKKKGKEDTKAKKKKGKADDDDDDDDDDDEKPKKKKGGSGLLLGIIGGVLLLCCVGCGGVGFAFQVAIKEAIGFGEKVSKAIEKDLKAIEKDLKAIDKKVADGKVDTKPLALKPDFTMTAVDFAQAFRENEETANKKYTGKVIEITGVLLTGDASVARFGQEGKLGVVLDGLGGRLNIPIQASDHARVYRLSREQKLKVVAPYQTNFGAIISFEMGTLTEIEKSKAIEISSENLVKEYLKDSLDADGKFRDKTVLITGEVIDLQKDTAKLKGDAGVAVLLKDLGRFEGQKLQKGMPATVRADWVRFDAGKKEVAVASFVVVDKK